LPDFGGRFSAKGFAFSYNLACIKKALPSTSIQRGEAIAWAVENLNHIPEAQPAGNSGLKPTTTFFRSGCHRRCHPSGQSPEMYSNWDVMHPKCNGEERPFDQRF